MAGFGRGLDQPATWATAFRQGAVFLAFAIPFVGLIGMIAGAWSVKGEWGNAADWIQAVGSIVAIVAAGYFPIRHYEITRRKHQQDLLELLRVLADEAAEAMWLLTNGFVHPDREVAQMREYVRFHRARDFDQLIAGLNEISIAELPPQRVKDLGHIRSAVQFGASVAALVPAWIKEGSSHPEDLVSLRAKRDLLDQIRECMGGSVVDAQLRGKSHERFREPLTILGCKVYRRYCWRNLGEGECPQRAQIQIVFPDKDDHPITLFVDSQPPGWSDLAQADAAVRREADARVRFFVMYGSQRRR